MQINNILVVSPKYQQLQHRFEERGLNKHFRFLREEQVNDEDLQWADAFIAFNLKTTFDYSQVKWVHSLGAGVDSLLYKRNWDENVLLTRTVCSFGLRIAEFCLSYILRDIQFHDFFLQGKTNKVWQPKTPNLLSEQKVMVFGTGEIGHKIAEVLSSLGVEVYGVSLRGTQKPFFNEVMTVETCFKRLAEVNYVINTLPLTEKTDNLFNDDFFKNVSNIGFINVGRGKSVNEAALMEALDRKNVRFAVLDVFSVEPLPEENFLWSHPNVLITPHISAVTAPNEAVDCFIETLNNLEENKPLPNQVDIRKGF